VACFVFTGISFFCYNVVGCAAIVLIAVLLNPLTSRRTATT